MCIVRSQIYRMKEEKYAAIFRLETTKSNTPRMRADLTVRTITNSKAEGARAHLRDATRRGLSTILLCLV